MRGTAGAAAREWEPALAAFTAAAAVCCRYHISRRATQKKGGDAAAAEAAAPPPPTGDALKSRVDAAVAEARGVRGDGVSAIMWRGGGRWSHPERPAPVRARRRR